MAACGIAPEDDDANAATASFKAQKPVQKQPVIPTDLSEQAIAQYIQSIANAKSMDELQQWYTAAKRTAKDCKNEAALNEFVSAKNKRKAELTEASE